MRRKTNLKFKNINQALNLARGSSTFTTGSLPSASPFRLSATNDGGMVDIHNCSERLERAKKRLSKLENSGLLLGFTAF